MEQRADEVLCRGIMFSCELREKRQQDSGFPENAARAARANRHLASARSGAHCDLKCAYISACLTQMSDELCARDSRRPMVYRQSSYADHWRGSLQRCKVCHIARQCERAACVLQCMIVTQTSIPAHYTQSFALCLAPVANLHRDAFSAGRVHSLRERSRHGYAQRHVPTTGNAVHSHAMQQQRDACAQLWHSRALVVLPAGTRNPPKQPLPSSGNALPSA